MTDSAANVPAGFEVMPPFGPFHQLVGPMYYKTTETGVVVGLLAEEKHRNAGTILHGGMIAMLADTAFTWATKHSKIPSISAVTTNLSINMIGSAKPGDWLEAHVEVVRSGRLLVFSNCFIWANGKRIAHAMAQFHVMEPKT